MTAKLTKELIKEKVTTDDRWAIRAIEVLYQYQTDDEQLHGETKHHNRVGFNGPDSPFMSSLAQQLKSGRVLSQKQLYYAKKKLGKYSGQLLKIAQEKES